jgi:hypothetical protein
VNAANPVRVALIGGLLLAIALGGLGMRAVADHTRYRCLVTTTADGTVEVGSTTGAPLPDPGCAPARDAARSAVRSSEWVYRGMGVIILIGALGVTSRGAHRALRRAADTGFAVIGRPTARRPW